MKHTYICNS